MGAMSRRKGQTGEREVCRILNEWLGLDVSRNLEQTRNGGSDISIVGWEIEVKRAKSYSRSWWQQAVTQAEKTGEKPLLVYRLDGMFRGFPEEEKWQAEMFAHDVIPFRKKSHRTVVTPLAVWMDIYRESIDET